MEIQFCWAALVGRARPSGFNGHTVFQVNATDNASDYFDYDAYGNDYEDVSFGPNSATPTEPYVLRTYKFYQSGTAQVMWQINSDYTWVQTGYDAMAGVAKAQLCTPRRALRSQLMRAKAPDFTYNKRGQLTQTWGAHAPFRSHRFLL